MREGPRSYRSQAEKHDKVLDAAQITSWKHVQANGAAQLTSCNSGEVPRSYRSRYVKHVRGA